MSEMDRTLHTGPRGGVYYLDDSGKKRYVKSAGGQVKSPKSQTTKSPRSQTKTGPRSPATRSPRSQKAKSPRSQKPRSSRASKTGKQAVTPKLRYLDDIDDDLDGMNGL